MSSINHIEASDPIQRVASNPIQKSVSADAAASPVPTATDRVELSGVSNLLQSLQANNIRTDKVASVRAQIEAGTYEDDQKLNIAADKLLDDLTR